MRHDLTTRPVRPDDIDVLVGLIRRNFDEVIAKYHSPAVVAKFRGNATRDRNAVHFYQRAGFARDPNQAESSDEITWMTMEI